MNTIPLYETNVTGGDDTDMTIKAAPVARPGTGRSNGKANLGANSEIGRKLKQYYDELVSDEVPDRFAQLLRELEENEPRTPPRQGD